MKAKNEHRMNIKLAKRDCFCNCDCFFVISSIYKINGVSSLLVPDRLQERNCARADDLVSPPAFKITTTVRFIVHLKINQR